jgi:lysophospholipase L1-like esterase
VRRRPAFLTATLTAAVLAFGTLAGSAQAAAPDRDRFASYVAMGDSYSATGLAPLDPGPAGSECGRSDATYSHLVAKELKVRSFHDVACSGADTADFFGAQHADTPRQLDGLRPSTRLVTMTIGGNDQNVFGGLITACAIASTAERNLTGSISGDPCRREFGSDFRDKIQDFTLPNLVRALKAVHKRAPKATVAILGYPQILPAQGAASCYSSIPVSLGDVPYLNRTQRTLNRAVERAARRTGSVYVDTSRISAGHDACQPVGTRWIEPLIGAQSTPMHPNVAGHQAMAAKLLKRLDRVRP